MKKGLIISFLLIGLIVISPCSVVVSASTAPKSTSEKSAFYQLENYILPNSNKVLLTEKDLYELTPNSIDLARNEIYARHGYIFKNENYSAYFSSKPWYKKNIKFKESLLNSVEKKNALFLKSYSDKIKANFKKVQGNTASLDLNGDSKKDTITLNCLEGSDYYELKVNNSSFSGTGINLDGVMYICDINAKDNYKEIAITESGPSCDYYTYLFYYDGKKLISIGGVEGTDFTLQITGSGKLVTKTRGLILHTWWYTDQYKLTSYHMLEQIPQKYYKMNSIVTVKTQIKLQKSPTDTRTAVVLKPGEKVLITDTDNKKWCAVQTSKGIKGWFSTDYYSKLYKINHNVFDGLNYAD